MPVVYDALYSYDGCGLFLLHVSEDSAPRYLWPYIPYKSVSSACWSVFVMCIYVWVFLLCCICHWSCHPTAWNVVHTTIRMYLLWMLGGGWRRSRLVTRSKADRVKTFGSAYKIELLLKHIKPDPNTVWTFKKKWVENCCWKRRFHFQSKQICDITDVQRLALRPVRGGRSDGGLEGRVTSNQIKLVHPWRS